MIVPGVAVTILISVLYTPPHSSPAWDMYGEFSLRINSCACQMVSHFRSVQCTACLHPALTTYHLRQACVDVAAVVVGAGSKNCGETWCSEAASQSSYWETSKTLPRCPGSKVCRMKTRICHKCVRC